MSQLAQITETSQIGTPEQDTPVAPTRRGPGRPRKVVKLFPQNDNAARAQRLKAVLEDPLVLASKTGSSAELLWIVLEKLAELTSILGYQANALPLDSVTAEEMRMERIRTMMKMAKIVQSPTMNEWFGHQVDRQTCATILNLLAEETRTVAVDIMGDAKATLFMGLLASRQHERMNTAQGNVPKTTNS